MNTKISPQTTYRAISLLSWMSLLGAFGAAVFLMIPTGSAKRSLPDIERPTLVSSQRQALAAGVALSNIEDLNVGDRVLVNNPRSVGGDRAKSDPDPDWWRCVDLEITKEDGYRLDITLLRPVAWLDHYNVLIGETIQLDIPEMNAYGKARVLDIGLCPPIKPSEGAIVVGTFRHTSGDIVDVGVSGLDEPVGTTADHPFWSEDREQFVEAGHLRLGERLRTHSGGFAHVTSISRRGPPEPVYNLQVLSDHLYHVSPLGILVHNYGDEAIPKHGSGAGLKNGEYDKLNGQGLYVLRDKKGVIRYVGIGDVPTRGGVHRRSKQFFEAIDAETGKLVKIKKGSLIQETVWDVGSLTKAEARGLEQRLMGRFGGPTTRRGAGETQLFFNNAVSYTPSNPNFRAYKTAVSKDLWNETLKRIRELDKLH